MFSWNSLVSSVIQRMLAIWCLVPLPFLNPAWTSGSSWSTLFWGSACKILNMTLLAWVVVPLLSRVWLFAAHGLQHASAVLPCPSPPPGACSNSYPLSQWCHSTTSSSVVPFSSCLQSCPASGSCLISWLFVSGGQSIGASASASVLPINTQGWFPVGLTGLITLQSKRLSRIFSNTTVQKHQFPGTQPPLWSNFHIPTWLLEKP